MVGGARAERRVRDARRTRRDGSCDGGGTAANRAEMATTETAPATAPEVAKPAAVAEPPPAADGDEGAAIERDLAALGQACNETCASRSRHAA